MAKRPTISLEKRDDRGGVYYWRAYLPRKDGKKGYHKVYRTTEVKDQVRAMAIAEAALDDLLDGKIEVVEKPIIGVFTAGQKISEQAATFVNRTMQYQSVSYRRETTRNLRFLSNYIRSADGKGEVRDLVQDISPLSIDHMMRNMNADREKDDTPYSFKYWAMILNDWDRWAGWQIKQPGNTMPQNWFTPDHIARPDKAKFNTRKEFWKDEEIGPFLDEAKKKDPELWKLVMVIRWTSMDPADYFDLTPEHLELKEDGHWYVVKERAKEPGMRYNVPIPDVVLPLFLEAKDTADREDFRMFTGRTHQKHQRSSWGAAITLRRGRLFKRLFPGKKVKSFKDLRRTFSDYWQRKGVPLPVVQEWMGHAEGSSITTSNYSDWRLTGDIMKAKTSS